MRKTLFILIFTLLVSNSYGQSKTIDSLKVELHKTVVDSMKVDITLKLCELLYEINITRSKEYVEEALKYALKSNNYRLSEVYNAMGVLQSDLENNEAARKYFDKALIELDKNDDKSIRGMVYGNYSETYENTNNFEKELYYSNKAIELNKEYDIELCFLYFNHSLIYENAGFHKESLYYMNLSKDLANSSGETRVEGYAIKVLIFYALNDNEIGKAKKYLERGLTLCNTTKSIEICHQINIAAGIYYTEIGKFNEAENAILKAKELALQREVKKDVVVSGILLGNLAFKKGDFKKAAQIFNTIDIDYYVVENEVYADIVYKNRSIAEEKIGNYKKSNVLLNQFVAFKDSVRLSKNRALLVEADRKYQVEKKDKELLSKSLAIQNKENEIQKKSNQMTLLYGISIFLLIASLLTWLIFQQKNKRKSQEIITLKREHQISTLESLMQGEEQERLRIAKELHDGVNGDLSAIKFKLSSLLEMNNKVIKEAVAMIDDSCKQVRAISHNLVPPSLENFNLVEASEEYCYNLNEVHAQEIIFQQLGDSFEISKNSEINIFRIIQELVSNSIKHAEADEINVQISCRENLLSLTVEDNGIGFDPKKVTSNGIGLKNIQSRVNYLEATMDLISNHDGTSYTIEIDLNKLNDDH